MTYCIDTSALLDAWVRDYSPDIMPSLWEKVDLLIQKGLLISSEEVIIELERKHGDTVYAWAKDRSQIFLPLVDEVQVSATGIMAEFPQLVDGRTGKSFADPWVVATAHIHGAAIVSGEKGTGSRQRPKIPDVCAHMNIPCMRFTDLIRAEGWKF